jgi:hypothetical protein
MTTTHAPIELDSGVTITPVRAYRLRGGYRLLVTAERAVWQEYDGRCYSLLATGQDWHDRSQCDDTINRANTCRVANFKGYQP